jgi:spoIIIJ-associated protein
VQEGTHGLLGIGGQPAVVRVTKRRRFADLAVEWTDKIVSAMGVQAEARLVDQDSDVVEIDLIGPGDLGLLLGRNGQTLYALQHLVNLIANRGRDDRGRVVLDVQGFRRQRERELEDLARRTASQVKETGDEVALDSLLPHERRVVHLALKDDPDIETYSVGDEPRRTLVVALREEAADSAEGEEPAPTDE